MYLAIDPIIHEDYDICGVVSNDIALLKLTENVDLNRFTPVCLPLIDADFTGDTAHVYGKKMFQNSEPAIHFTNLPPFSLLP